MSILKALNMNKSLKVWIGNISAVNLNVCLLVCLFSLWYPTFKSKFHQIQYQTWVMNNYSHVWQPFWIFNTSLVTSYGVIAQVIIYFKFETEKWNKNRVHFKYLQYSAKSDLCLFQDFWRPFWKVPYGYTPLFMSVKRLPVKVYHNCSP